MSSSFLDAAAVRRASSNLASLGTPTAEASSPNDRASKASHTGVSLSDFELGRVLGRGSFGTVALATKTSTGETYAMKSLSKRMLIAVRQTDSAMLERVGHRDVDTSTAVKGGALNFAAPVAPHDSVFWVLTRTTH